MAGRHCRPYNCVPTTRLLVTGPGIRDPPRVQTGLSLLVSSPLPPRPTVWEALGSLEISEGLGMEGRTLVGDTLYSRNPCPTNSAGTAFSVASENNSIASRTLQCIHINSHKLGARCGRYIVGVKEAFRGPVL